MRAADVVVALSGARRAVQLYPATHPAFVEAIELLVESVNRSLSEGPLVLNVHQGHMYHESLVVPDDVHGAERVAEAFETHRIQSLTFEAGFSNTDAVALVAVLSMRPAADFDAAAQLAEHGAVNISISALEDDNQEEREERDRRRAQDRALYHRLVSHMRAMSEKMSSGGGIDLSDAGGMVANVLSRFSEDSNAVLALATIRGESDRQLFHSLNVMIFSVALGQRLGLPDEGLQTLALSALLHDVGKTAFDQSDPAQLEPMRVMHPAVGAEILQRVALEDPAPMLVAYEHHMTADGGGYPEHETSYVAHPYSRMVTIADRYDNLTSSDGTSESLTPDRAIVQILREAGATLDPFFARLFASALGVFPVGSMVRLSDHSVGVVSRLGEDPLAPVVRLAYGPDGAELEEQVDVDLSGGDARIVEVIQPDALNVKVADKL